MLLLPTIFIHLAKDAGTLRVSDAAALAIHLFGSVLNSASEWQRWRWKRQPQNARRLYVEGFFGIAKHINYTGEILTHLGWALLSRHRVALIVPTFFALALCFAYAPDLQQYIRKRYGDDAQFARWQATSDFMPDALWSWLLALTLAWLVASLPTVSTVQVDVFGFAVESIRELRSVSVHA